MRVRFSFVTVLLAATASALSMRRAPPRMAQRSTIRMPSQEPMVPWKPPGMEGHQFVSVSQRLFRERIVILGDFLDEEKANNLIATLMYLKNEDPKKQINLYFNVPGALMKPTLAVYDTLMDMECPIMTLNMGLATGMAAFLCGAGTPGLRFAMPNARYLLQKTGLDDPFQVGGWWGAGGFSPSVRQSVSQSVSQSGRQSGSQAVSPRLPYARRGMEWRHSFPSPANYPSRCAAAAPVFSFFLASLACAHETTNSPKPKTKNFNQNQTRARPLTSGCA